MRGARVEYLPEARQELEDSLEWYLEPSLQTAEVFVREIEPGIEVIAFVHHKRRPRYWLRRVGS